MRDLRLYVANLEKRIENEEDFSDSVAKNTRILKEDADTLAIKTNIVSTSFSQFRQHSTCNIFRVASTIEKRRLYNRMDSFVNSIIGGKLTPRVIPIGLLSDIIRDTGLIKGTLLEKNPLKFYSEATISLRAIDKAKQTITILLAVPKISSQPDFVSLNLISPKAIVMDGNKPRSRQLQTPTNLYLPTKVFEESNKFPLMNDEAVNQIQKLGDCEEMDEDRVCKNVFPLSVGERDCLSSILKGVDSQGSCHVNQAIVSAEPTFVLEEGELGTLIVASDSYSIFGTVGKRKERLTLATTHSHRRICVYIPSKYDTITIKNATFTSTIHQAVQTMVDVAEATTEVGYFSLNSPHWSDRDILERNLTIKALDKMIRKRYFGGLLSSGISTEMMLVAILSVLVCVGFLLIFAIHKGWLKIQVRPRNASNVTIPNQAVRQETTKV